MMSDWMEFAMLHVQDSFEPFYGKDGKTQRFRLKRSALALRHLVLREG